MVEILFSRPYEEIVKIANAYHKSKSFEKFEMFLIKMFLI